MRLFIILALLYLHQPLMAQQSFTKLIGRNGIGEIPMGIKPFDDGTLVVQVRSIYDGFNYTFGWIHMNQNGDTLSSFLYNMPTLRSDGLNSLVVKQDTIFQLIKHRDSISNIRIYASNTQGDSLLRWDYDWERPDWGTILASNLHRTNEGDFLILGSVQKKISAWKWDIFAILIGPNGLEKWRKVIVSDYVPVNVSADVLITWFIQETENGYYFSTKNMSGDVQSSADIFKVSKHGEVIERFYISQQGLNDDLNPISLSLEHDYIYYSNSRIIHPPDLVGSGLAIHEITNPNMVVGLIDTLGNLIWDRPEVLPSGNWLTANNAKTVKNGDFVICGGWQIQNQQHGFIARYNQQGDLLWRYVIPLSFPQGQSVLRMTDFIEDEDGSLLFCGELEDRTINYPYNLDVFLLKIPGSGCEAPLYCSNDTILSNIRLLPGPINSELNLKLYPNPIFPGQSINLELSGVISGMADFRWIDLNGKILHQQDVEINENAPSLQVPSQLGAGWYFVELRDTEGKITTAKLVVWERL